MSQQEANGIVRAAHRARRATVGMRVAVPTAAALGVGAAIAIGSIPSTPGGTITGCYNTIGSSTNVGALRVLDPSITSPASGQPVDAACDPKTEATVTWNQSGPAGPTGPAGPAGAPGAPGAAGPAGAPFIGQTTFGIKRGGSQVFAKIDGIAGDSKVAGHQGEIELSSFSIGAGQAGAGGGGGAGKTSFQDLHFVHRVDKASPKLLAAAASGQHIKSAIIVVRKAGGDQKGFVEYKAQNVLVTGVTQGVNSHNVPSESVSLNFAKMTVQYMGTTQAGKGFTSPQFTLTFSGGPASAAR